MGVLYLVKIEVAPEAERAWQTWNTEHHIPDVLAQAGFVRATKYRLGEAPGGWARYWVFYEVESRAALDAYLGGEEVKRLRGDHLQRFGGSSRLSREILEEAAVVEGVLGRA
jgi:hypothetical protein